MAAETHSTDQRIEAGYLQRQWGKLSVSQLNLICLLIVLIMTGAVSWTDIMYPLFSTAYIIFFAARIFPPVSHAAPANPFKGNTLFKYYVSFGGFIGVLIPSIFILLSFIWGDRDGAASATPHLFLLIAQIVTEGFAVDKTVSAPIKVLIPASYNTKRLVTLLHWAKVATGREVRSAWTLPWQLVEGLLAISNLVFWTYNLLGFLLPVYLPLQLCAYYQQEAKWKKAPLESTG
jgi:hypothetical protein